MLFKVLTLPGDASSTRGYLVHRLLLLSCHHIALNALLFGDFEPVRDDAFILLLLNFQFLVNRSHLLLLAMYYLVGSAHGLAPIRLCAANDAIIGCDGALGCEVRGPEASKRRSLVEI